MARVAGAAGNGDDECAYAAAATDLIRRWAVKAQDPSGAHTMLAYDRPGTWSLKYNAFADALLRLGLVPEAVRVQEATWYAGRQQPYGVPLDPRHTYTKLDWELWTAAWVGGEVRDRLVAAACDYVDATPSRVPLSDWYETAAPPVTVGSTAQPVVGGVYSLAVLHGPAHSTLYEATVLATPGLAGYWRLGERSGTRAADATGRHDGTYVGAPRLGVAGALTGCADTAVSVDGAGQYVRLPRLVQGDFSLELWFRSAGGGVGTANDQWWQGAGLFDGEVAGVTGDFGTSLDATGRVWAGTGDPDRSIHSPPGLDDDWHHVVFTRVRSTGALALYVDGVAVATGVGGRGSLTAPPVLRLGALQTGATWLRGSLDEAALYGVALDPATVARHHAAGRQ